MHVVAVEEAARQAAQVVRGGSPFFLECRTYRFRAHSMADPELYRTKEEVEEWKQRDPISTFITRLALTPGDLAGIEADVDKEIAEAISFAESGPWEPLEDLTKDVYARRPS